MVHSALLLLTTLFIACHPVKPNKSEISKVELATTGSGRVPRRAISVDSSLKFKFYTDTVSSTGLAPSYPRYYEGRISKALWDSLQVKLADIKYKQMASVHPEDFQVNDAYGVELILYSNGTHKRIIRTLKSTSVTHFDHLVEWMIKLPEGAIIKETNVHQLMDTLHFGTTWQNNHYFGEREKK